MFFLLLCCLLKQGPAQSVRLLDDGYSGTEITIHVSLSFGSRCALLNPSALA